MSLIKLARDGDYAGVVRVLADRPSIANETDELGHSALFCAVIGKHVEICRILLERGFDANETSADFGFTVLHKACFSGSLEICKMLVERGADVSYKDPKDSDAFYNAITGAGDLAMCRYLVSKGASREGALHLACFNGKLEVVAWLLDEASNDASRGADTDGVNTRGYRDNTPLHLACQQGHYELCKLLIERGANVKSRNAAGCTPLHEAVLAPNGARITVLLIKHGADLNGKDHEDRAPLHKASSMGHIEHCKALIEIGANINILDQSKCRLELSNNKSPLKGAVGMGDSALHYAILSGNIEMCAYLLDRGIDMHIKSAQGKPIVHFACHHKKYKICALLIDRGADIDALDYKQVQIPSGAPRRTIRTQQNEPFMLSLTYSETALQNAAQSGNTEACQLLIRKGAEVSAGDEIFGNTALHLAAKEGHREVCSILLLNGAEIGATNRFFDSESEWNREDTALHLAAREGHWDVCQLLIESGADVWCKNRMNQHCLAVAERSIRPALLQLLRRLKPEDQQNVGIWEAMSRSMSVVRPTIPASGSNSSLSTAVAEAAPTSAARAGSADHAAGQPSISSPNPAPSLSLSTAALTTALTDTDPSGNNTPSEAPPSPTSLNAVTPYCGPEKVWKHRKLRFSTRRNVFSQTVWECEILELSSRPGEGAWVTTVPSTSAAPRKIPVHCIPGDVEVERNGVIDVRLVFTLPGAKHSHLKLSFGTDRARRSAWKAAFMKHLRNGK